MHLRFFLSSPGDVADERTFAQQVIEQELPKDPLLRGQITCEAMRWDDPNAPVTMPATLTPQEAVNRGLSKPSECDAVMSSYGRGSEPHFRTPTRGRTAACTYQVLNGSTRMRSPRNRRRISSFITEGARSISVIPPTPPSTKRSSNSAGYKSSSRGSGMPMVR